MPIRGNLSGKMKEGKIEWMCLLYCYCFIYVMQRERSLKKKNDI